jgi:hypothetical protein
VPVRTGRAGEVRVTTDRRGSARATTENVFAMTLSPPASLFEGGVTRVALTVDGDRVALSPGAENHIVRRDGHWIVGAAAAVGGGGPIREVFDSPMVFVIGTGDPSLTRVHERVARSWAHRPGVPMRYPVVTDDGLTDAMRDGRTLVLIGTPRTNRALARVADRLPVRFDGDDIVIGPRRLHGDDLGVAFAAPDPDHPARTLLVIAGNSAAAMLRSNALPDLLPSYVAWDASVAPARGRILLGPRARVLAAGFFDASGAPLDVDADPVATDPAAPD